MTSAIHGGLWLLNCELQGMNVRDLEILNATPSNGL
jgi:hypothetical protein